jgi:pyruvate/2-oxoglutarate dehydrogenase complex dihydrolipoamide acyltransferase (E2) component
MPQMGESIAEGTIVRWIKKVGDAVDRDEPLFEISTDKVDAEIPSPAAGVLLQISVNEGETVPVDSVVGLIGAAGESVAAARPAADAGSAAPPGASRARGAARRRCAVPIREPTARRLAPRRIDARRPPPPQVVAGRPAHRPRPQRRHRGADRIGHRRAGHQARHPRLHRARRIAAAGAARRCAGPSHSGLPAGERSS